MKKKFSDLKRGDWFRFCIPGNLWEYRGNNWYGPPLRAGGTNLPKHLSEVPVYVEERRDDGKKDIE